MKYLAWGLVVAGGAFVIWRAAKAHQSGASVTAALLNPGASLGSLPGAPLSPAAAAGLLVNVETRHGVGHFN